MSTLLMLEVMDDAPDSLTWRERYVLMALADNFSDKTRVGWPAFEGDDDRSKKFRRRARCTRAQFYETLNSLIAKGVVEQVVRGQKYRQAVYRIPPLAGVLSVPKTRTLKKGSPRVSDTPAEGFPEPSGEGSGGDAEPPQGPGNPDTEELSGSGNDRLRVRENRTPIPQYSSNQDLLKAANAASVGWGVWGEGSATAPADAGSQPVTASADAAAGDGLRPRGCAAPAQMNDQPSTHGQKPAPDTWEAGQEPQRQAERARILAAVQPECDDMLIAFELALTHHDASALDRGRLAARTDKSALPPDSDDDPALHERVWALVHAYNSKPLAAWPVSVLPIPLRERDLKDAA